MTSAEYVNQLFGLNNLAAVVVGATGTLGGAFAEGLAQAGAHVVVAGRNREQGQRRVEKIKAEGGKASFLAVAAEERDAVQALLQQSLQVMGRVDILVNCAGANSASSYLEATDAEWERVFAANLRSTHLGCQIFGKHMAEHGGGSIINIGSVAAEIPLSKIFAYSASKAAVLSLTRNVARELAPMKVRVNCLCPGFFPAEQNRAILTQERVASVMKHTPMARFGEPQELIGAILLMASPKAGSFLTGAAIYVDGGFTCMTI